MNRNLMPEIVTASVIILFIIIFAYVSGQGHEFSGADDLASGKVSELTGMPEESFTPLIPQWQPPSGEIESLLFALQGTIGGLILGLVLGFWYAQSRQKIC
ncbi:MAG TPA: energy-coupling factor ABC transporter substrate-binding protein [Methanospirillum sp.]|nr:energy-coupling factor ABC transporter substrate-binding protein [Methanospirillum sp.]